MNERKQITFFASYFEAAHELPDAERLAIYDAILSMAFDDADPHPASPVARAVWAAIRPNVQHTINKSNAGMCGGGQVGNQNARKYPRPEPEPVEVVEPVEIVDEKPTKNEQKTNTIPTENEQKTSNKEKDKEKDKGKEKEFSLSITPNGVCQIWNEICAANGLPKVIKMTDRRADKTRTRIREMQKGGGDAAETFRNVCSMIANSKFCKGQNTHKWQATFDWLIENDMNYIKVLEGKYDNDKQKIDYGSRHLNERAAENDFWANQHNAARTILAGGRTDETIPHDGGV